MKLNPDRVPWTYPAAPRRSLLLANHAIALELPTCLGVGVLAPPLLVLEWHANVQSMEGLGQMRVDRSGRPGAWIRRPGARRGGRRGAPAWSGGASRRPAAAPPRSAAPRLSSARPPLLSRCCLLRTRRAGGEEEGEWNRAEGRVNRVEDGAVDLWWKELWGVGGYLYPRRLRPGCSSQAAARPRQRCAGRDPPRVPVACNLWHQSFHRLAALIFFKMYPF